MVRNDEPEDEVGSFANFEKRSDALEQQNRYGDWFMVLCGVLLVPPLLMNILYVHHFLFTVVVAGALGANIGTTFARRRSINRLREYRSTLWRARAEAQEQFHRMQAAGLRMVAVFTQDDPEDDYDSPFNGDVYPGHPMWDLIMGTKDHGHVAGLVVKTEDGWEVLHGNYSDGTLYGPHEPPHEERLADG